MIQQERYAEMMESMTPMPLQSGEAPDGLLGPGIFGALAPLADQKNISSVTNESARKILAICETASKQLELESALQRIARLQEKLSRPLTWKDYKIEMVTLREAFEDSLNDRYCYYANQAKYKIYKSCQKDWEQSIKAFPSAACDISSAVNCYLYGCNTACVFHLMRVAEFGLRALARERRVTLPKNRPLEWADWQALIDEIHKKVKVIANMKRGPARETALRFYQGSLGEFEAFKDAYRNNVMHSRENYDELQALSVMNHVREFMQRLSSKITEDPKRQVAWGLKK